MRLRDFIRDNRTELDTAIRGALKDPEYKLNNHERELWVMNDEGLYHWARRSGVRI